MSSSAFSSFASALLLAVVLLGGCAGLKIGANASMPLVLHRGDTASYVGSDGSKLTSTIVGSGEQSDPWLQPVPVIIVEYKLTPAGDGWSQYVFKEAIDHDGRIVAQVANCVFPASPSSNSGACFTNRTGIYYGAWGWPGGLGAAPMWFESGIASEINLPSRVAGPEGRIHVTHVAADGCQDYQYRGTNVVAGTIPLAIGDGHAVLCPQQPFPSLFTSSAVWQSYVVKSGRIEFSLQKFTPGTEAILRPAALGATHASAVEFQDLATPLYQKPAPDSFPFATMDAINASDSESEVSAFRKAHPSAIPVESFYSVSSKSEGGLLGGSDVTDHRALALADGSGACMAFKVDRTNHNATKIPIDQAKTTYMVGKPHACLDIHFDLQSISRRQATYESAASWAEGIEGMKRTSFKVGYTQLSIYNGWAAASSGGRSDGYALLIKLRDPYPGQQGSVLVRVDYTAVVDGPSGSLLMIEIVPPRNSK